MDTMLEDCTFHINTLLDGKKMPCEVNLNEDSCRLLLCTTFLNDGLVNNRGGRRALVKNATPKWVGGDDFHVTAVDTMKGQINCG